MANIKAFIFDMDGVLTETSEMHYLAWKALADSIGITIDRVFNEQLKGVSRRESLEKILQLNKQLNFTEEEILALMAQKNEQYIKMIQQIDGSHLCEGILELLEELKKRDIKIAVASASHSAPMLVDLLNIKTYIDYIVDPSTVKSKPSPEIFIKAAEGLHVAIKNCVGVEDAEAGIRSIKSAGMYAIGIGDAQQLKAADIVYNQTNKLIYDDILRGFNGQTANI